jgi:DNA-binding MarR family transcriptional regulator
MVMINSNSPSKKTPIKGELLCKLFDRYPSIDVSTVQLVSLIQAIGRNLSMFLNCDLSDHGLTEGKFYVLAYLFSEELLGHEAPSPSQIADHVGVTRGTVTGLLDGLEREGFITRFHDPRDRRGLTIQINGVARDFLDSYLPTITGGLSKFIPLSAEEKSLLLELLEKIDRSLGETVSNEGRCLAID